MGKGGALEVLVEALDSPVHRATVSWASSLPPPGTCGGWPRCWTAPSASRRDRYLSDAVFHPLHIEHPHWLPDAALIADVDQSQATASRLIARAAARNAIVLGMHFPPFP